MLYHRLLGGDWCGYDGNENIVSCVELSENNLNKIIDWKNINELIPKYYFENKMKKTGIAGIFAASLELSKEGIVKVSQKNTFDKLMIKKN